MKTSAFLPMNQYENVAYLPFLCHYKSSQLRGNRMSQTAAKGETWESRRLLSTFAERSANRLG